MYGRISGQDPSKTEELGSDLLRCYQILERRMRTFLCVRWPSTTRLLADKMTLSFVDDSRTKTSRVMERSDKPRAVGESGIRYYTRSISLLLVACRFTIPSS